MIPMEIVSDYFWTFFSQFSYFCAGPISSAKVTVLSVYESVFFADFYGALNFLGEYDNAFGVGVNGNELIGFKPLALRVPALPVGRADPRSVAAIGHQLDVQQFKVDFLLPIGRFTPGAAGGVVEGIAAPQVGPVLGIGKTGRSGGHTWRFHVQWKLVPGRLKILLRLLCLRGLYDLVHAEAEEADHNGKHHALFGNPEPCSYFPKPVFHRYSLGIHAR